MSYLLTRAALNFWHVAKISLFRNAQDVMSYKDKESQLSVINREVLYDMGP